MKVVGFFEGLDGVMKNFVDDSADKLFELDAILLGKIGESVHCAFELFLGDRVVASVELLDDRAHFSGAMPGEEFIDGGADKLASGINFRGALGLGDGDDLLEVVDVVEIDVFELPGRFLDVAREGDVDNENGTIAALSQRGLDHGAQDNWLG